MSASRSERLRAARLAWLFNLLLAIAIATSYVDRALVDASARAWIFVCAALVSSVLLLTLAPALCVSLCARIVRGARLLALVQAFVWTSFQLFLFADTRIYGLFRYHFNAMVWNVITTPGAEDAIELGVRTWIVVVIGGLLLFAFQERMWSLVFVRWSAEARSRSAKRVLRTAYVLLALAVLTDKVLYARADLARDARIASLSRFFPYYQPLTVAHMAQRWFGVELQARAKVELGAPSLLRYPRAQVALGGGGARPNILIVVIDSLRSDMLAPATMPRVASFAQHARRFDDHASGGNATRFGIFSLLYGIHGAYWMQVANEHTPPLLVTELARLGYDLRVLSSASMNFPEFRSTAWVTIEDKVEDQLAPKIKCERDALCAQRFESWLDERTTRGAREPFFCFVLLDAAHGNHSFPADETPFVPFAPRIDFLKLSGSPSEQDVREAFNSYRNAVHFTDRVTGRMLDALAQRGLADDTLVVVTGDHGDEFREHGYYGHTSNYTREQVHVPFVLGGPGVPPGVETRPTSHLDLVPTLFELLGCDPARRADYSNGLSLLDPPAQRERMICGWEELALWTDDGVLFVPLAGHKGGVEAYDYDWRRLADEDAWIARHASAIGHIARECRWFLR